MMFFLTSIGRTGNNAASRQKARQIANFALSRRRHDGRRSHYYQCAAGAVTVAATTLAAATSMLQQEHEEEEERRNREDGKDNIMQHDGRSRLSLVSSNLMSSSLVSAPATAQCDWGMSFLGRVASVFTGGGGQSAVDDNLEARYEVDWDNPIGEGTFGSVYKAKDKRTGEAVAVKKITKLAEGDESYEREMDALMQIRDHGGHPGICGLRAKYEKGEYHYLVLDLISGGEMFDHLAAHGPYSEADAARLIREVASALAFLHGLNVVHGDLKPENLMLSSEKSSAAVVKIVDFGSASMKKDGDEKGSSRFTASATPAYSPPEFLDYKNVDKSVDPSFDMWALGVIVYSMLTGVHPFDLYGNSSDEEIEKEIRSGHKPPTRNSPLTAHLSGSAIKLLEKLLEWEPSKRLTAFELLENPWVQGKTARQQKMANSDKRLSALKTLKTKLEAKVFADMVASGPGDGITRRTSLIERAFQELDPEGRGYVTTKDLRKLAGDKGGADDGGANEQVSLSGFSHLLSDSMKNRYFPKGHIVYREGEIGNHMYFINSGTISIETRNGSTVTRGPGDFFGEGALLHPHKLRSATTRCTTPLHIMEISREYFEKYMKDSDEGLFLELKETDKSRKRNRSKMILRAQNNIKEREFKEGEALFTVGEEGDILFLVEDGKVDVVVGDKIVFSATKGNLCGEYSPLMGRLRNCTALCRSKKCKVYEMTGRDFRALLDLTPDMKRSLYDLCLRRDFKKAVVRRLKKEFPYQNPREAFDVVKRNKSGEPLTFPEITELMLELNPNYTADEIREILTAVKLTRSGSMSFDEFKKVFFTDKRTSSSNT